MGCARKLHLFDYRVRCYGKAIQCRASGSPARQSCNAGYRDAPRREYVRRQSCNERERRSNWNTARCERGGNESRGWKRQRRRQRCAAGGESSRDYIELLRRAICPRFECWHDASLRYSADVRCQRRFSLCRLRSRSRRIGRHNALSSGRCDVGNGSPWRCDGVHSKHRRIRRLLEHCLHGGQHRALRLYDFCETLTLSSESPTT